MTTVTSQQFTGEKTGVPRPRLMTFLFGFCMFSTGASGLVNEYVLATMTTYILGNSIEQFSIIIALMMLMMGLSGLVQEKMSDEGLIGKFMAVEIAMAILGSFAPIATYAAFGYLSEHFILIHYVLVMAIGFLIGFEIPLVMRIIDQYGVGIKHNLRTVYAMDYIGAFVGAVVWVKVLLNPLPLTEISFVVAGCNFVVAAVTVFYFMGQRVITSRVYPSAALLATAIALIYGYSHNRDWSMSMEQKFYEDPIVAVKNTAYQHLVLTENRTLGDVRLYINGNTQFSSKDERQYHELLVHPAMTLATNPHHILILGGGDGLALREVLKYPTVETATLVDLDPGMIQFASTNPLMRMLNKDAFADARTYARASQGVTALGKKSVYLEIENETAQKPGERPRTEWVATVNVYNVDADRFVSESHDRVWDVILIDFPDPDSVELAKLYSKEFFTKLRWHMHTRTIVAIQSTSPYHAKEAYLTVKRTMEAAGLKTLPYRHNIPSFGDWGWILAWNGDASREDVKQHLASVDQFAVSTAYLNPETMMASFAFGKGELHSTKTDINTLMQPVLLDEYLHYSWLIE